MDTKGGFYITQIKQLQDRIFTKLLQNNDIELSGGQGRILFILWKEDNLTVSELSQRTSLAKNTVSIVVDGMVRKGIVERQIDPHNRRQTFILLTDYARSLQQQYQSISQQMNELFYQGFTSDEQQLFESFLKRIRDTLVQAENDSLL